LGEWGYGWHDVVISPSYGVVDKELRWFGRLMGHRVLLAVSRCVVYRHRPVMNIVDKKPALATGAWVAPSAAVIGSVNLGPSASVWYNSVVKGGPTFPSPVHFHTIKAQFMAPYSFVI
jgi:hypothetical protein